MLACLPRDVWWYKILPTWLPWHLTHSPLSSSEWHVPKKQNRPREPRVQSNRKESHPTHTLILPKWMPSRLAVFLPTMGWITCCGARIEFLVWWRRPVIKAAADVVVVDDIDDS
eukprot:scaffold185499_cov33-Attheya_sp.AAC.1